MVAVGALIAFVVVAFVIVAGLSLLIIGVSTTPPFARRATSAIVQLRQDPSAGFILDRRYGRQPPGGYPHFHLHVGPHRLS